MEGDGLLSMQVNPYKLHRLEEGPEREVETTKGELLQMFRSMYQVATHPALRLSHCAQIHIEARL